MLVEGVVDRMPRYATIAYTAVTLGVISTVVLTLCRDRFPFLEVRERCFFPPNMGRLATKKFIFHFLRNDDWGHVQNASGTQSACKRTFLVVKSNTTRVVLCDMT